MKTSKDMNQKAEQLMTELKDKAFKSHTPTPFPSYNLHNYTMEKVTPEWYERIVRAVNCHEELVFQLKAAEQWISRAREILTHDQQGYCGFFNHKPAKEAIAKAEGR